MTFTGTLTQYRFRVWYDVLRVGVMNLSNLLYNFTYLFLGGGLVFCLWLDCMKCVPYSPLHWGVRSERSPSNPNNYPDSSFFDGVQTSGCRTGHGYRYRFGPVHSSPCHSTGAGPHPECRGLLLSICNFSQPLDQYRFVP